MITDYSIAPISAMMTTFAAKRRSGRIITIQPDAFVGEVLRFWSVFARETRGESALRGACVTGI